MSSKIMMVHNFSLPHFVCCFLRITIHWDFHPRDLRDTQSHYLVGGLEHVDYFPLYIYGPYGIILPIDFHIFQDG